MQYIELYNAVPYYVLVNSSLFARCECPAPTVGKKTSERPRLDPNPRMRLATFYL